MPAGGVLTNLNTLLPAQERYSYLFDGNAQQIDNILVTAGLLDSAYYDAVHLNSQFGGTRPTDHDPQITLLRIGAAAGSDSFYGTSGNDTYTVDNPGDRVYEQPNGGTDTINSSITYSLVDAPNVENLTLTGTANIDGTGNAGNNVLTGNSGDNSLDGNGGTDTLIGGAGYDIYTVDSADDVVVENAGEGIDIVKASASYSIATEFNIELLRLIGTGNFDATGNSEAQKLVGNSGDNVLDGGGGGDVLRGAAGNDTYIMRDATDRIVEVDGNGSDIVKAAVSYTLAADASIETLRTIDDNASTAIDLTGNSHTTLIVGNAGANRLTGGSGDEMLTGGGGADVFVFAGAGVGHDTVGDFVSGTDRLDLSAYFANFSTFQAATHDVGGNAVIDLGSGQTVTLSGVLSAQIQSGDVITASGQAPLKLTIGDVQHWLSVKHAGEIVHNIVDIPLLGHGGPSLLPAFDYLL